MMGRKDEPVDEKPRRFITYNNDQNEATRSYIPPSL